MNNSQVTFIGDVVAAHQITTAKFTQLLYDPSHHSPFLVHPASPKYALAVLGLAGCVS